MHRRRPGRRPRTRWPADWPRDSDRGGPGSRGRARSGSRPRRPVSSSSCWSLDVAGVVADRGTLSGACAREVVEGRIAGAARGKAAQRRLACAPASLRLRLDQGLERPGLACRCPPRCSRPRRRRRPQPGRRGRRPRRLTEHASCCRAAPRSVSTSRSTRCRSDPARTGWPRHRRRPRRSCPPTCIAPPSGSAAAGTRRWAAGIEHAAGLRRPDDRSGLDQRLIV